MVIIDFDRIGDEEVNKDFTARHAACTYRCFTSNYLVVRSQDTFAYKQASSQNLTVHSRA